MLTKKNLETQSKFDEKKFKILSMKVWNKNIVGVPI
jgi:hypothetical protein